MITCTIQPNGNLLITACNETRAEIAAMQRNNRDYWSIMADLFESYSCNGSYTPFDAGNGNPFVGLTGAPCIAESMSYDDNGQAEIIGKFWYFSDYVFRDDLDELKRYGRVIYRKAP